MSMDGRTMSHHKISQSKERGPSVVIPNIPKMIDEKARMKLMSDYEKYEPELFKHHIGTPESTQTIGLKSIAADFDRRVPTKNEPTLADRDYEARRRHKAPRSGVGTPYSSAVPGTSPRRLRGESSAAETCVAASAKAPVVVPMPPHVLPLDKQPSPPQQQQEQPPPPPPQEQEVQRTSTQSLVSQPVSPRRPKVLRPHRPMSSSPPKARRQHGAMLAPLRGNLRHAMNVGTSGEKMSAERCGVLLRVLLDTPTEYSESFDINLHHIDLGWMRTNRFPSVLVTLHSFNSPAQVINSPRSVLTLLRNGLVVRDLLSHEVRDEDVQLPADMADLSNEAELRRIAKRTRQERLNHRRNKMLEKLNDEYASLCQRVSLANILEVFRSALPPPDGDDDLFVPVGQVTAAMRDRQERWKQSLAAARKQLERQMCFVRDVQSRQAAAELRQAAAAEDARRHVARHRERSQSAQLRGRDRLAQARQRAEAAGGAFARRLAERQAAAASRQAQRAEARRQRAEAQQATRQARAAELSRRAERVAAAQSAAAVQLAQRVAEREARREGRAALRRRNTAVAHDAMAARAREAQATRDAAAERAAQREAAVREAAEAQQQRVDERLARFVAEREAQVRRKAEEDAAREERRTAVRAQAERVAVMRAEAAALTAERKEGARRSATARAAEERVMRREGERDLAEEKAFQVLQSRRLVEFDKLEGVYKLVEKRGATQALERQREAIHREKMRCREEIMQEREELKLQFAKEAESLTRSYPEMYRTK